MKQDMHHHVIVVFYGGRVDKSRKEEYKYSKRPQVRCWKSEIVLSLQ